MHVHKFLSDVRVLQTEICIILQIYCMSSLHHDSRSYYITSSWKMTNIRILQVLLLGSNTTDLSTAC